MYRIFAKNLFRMIRLLILGLAIYGAYQLFFKPKKIEIQNDKKDNKNFTDYEEVE